MSHMFNLLQNCQTVFQSGFIILHSHQQYESSRVSLPTSCTISLFNVTYFSGYVVVFSFP